ncbi:MAG: acyloxyacyl hydrolase [Syntrophales bacterium]
MLNTSRLRKSYLGFILLCILLTYPLIGMSASHLEPLPERFDLRNIDRTVYIGPVKNQGDIGNCYGFATAAGYDTPTTSYIIRKVATEGRSFDICERDKQVPDKLSLLSISIRARVSSIDVLGDVAPEKFQEYDVAAYFRLPWAWYSQSGWGTGIRLMTSAGVLYGAGDTALVISLIPLITIGSQDGRFSLDMGAGGALLSNHRFGTQDYGGYFQFALTAGVGVPLFKRLGVGYRFLHYSDAGIYGPHNMGADFHMLELNYRF